MIFPTVSWNYAFLRTVSGTVLKAERKEERNVINRNGDIDERPLICAWYFQLYIFFQRGKGKSKWRSTVTIPLFLHKRDTIEK